MTHFENLSLSEDLYMVPETEKQHPARSQTPHGDCIVPGGAGSTSNQPLRSLEAFRHMAVVAAIEMRGRVLLLRVSVENDPLETFKVVICVCLISFTHLMYDSSY